MGNNSDDHSKLEALILEIYACNRTHIYPDEQQLVAIKKLATKLNINVEAWE
jgi:hypothetical protein|tara:strand:+ start:550 stop:705 length:156 start_codon:yes stop_codon:yes gene_type:complete